MARRPKPPAREKSLGLLSRVSGLPLCAYKPEHIDRQVGTMLRAEGAADTEEMAALLARSDAARRRFRSAIAISISGHLRDPHQFALLRDEVFPRIVDREGMIRVWSAGCADRPRRRRR